jgi:phosphatidylinositol alpha-1,6-mannosyltransferase
MSVSASAGKTCLLVTNLFPPAIGGSSQVYAALASFSNGGIAVLTSSYDYETGRERENWRQLDRQAAYRVHRLKCVRPFFRSAFTGFKLSYRMHELVIAVKLIAAVMFYSWRYRVAAVCIADDETVGWLVVLVKYVLRRRALIYCHGDDLQGGKDAVARRRRWLRLTDTVVAANRYSSNLLTTVFGVPADLVAVIPNGVDLAEFYPQDAPALLIQKYGLSDRKVLLTVTRLVPRKGVDAVLKALPGVARRFANVIYLIVGDGPQFAQLQTMARDLGIAELVRFVGRVAHGEMRNFYNAADLVLLPNRAQQGESDGLPLVFLEANACAKPVIGGNAGGTAEIISNGVNGLIVDGGNSAEIETAICRLLDDDDRRRSMGQKGFLMARSWGWETRVQHFMDLCRK